MFNFSKKLKKHPGIWPYVFEFFTVLLSVYLAFLITEWREDYKTKQEIKVAKERLDLEILDNYFNLIDFDNDVSKRYEVLVSLESKITGVKCFEDYRTLFNGYRLAGFKSTSWERVAKSRLVDLMPVEYIESVNGIYKLNQNLEALNHENNSLFMGEVIFDKKRAKIAYRMAVRFVWQQKVWAKSFLKGYNIFLKENPDILVKLQNLDSLSYQHYLKRDSILTARQNAKSLKAEMQLPKKKSE